MKDHPIAMFLLGGGLAAGTATLLAGRGSVRRVAATLSPPSTETFPASRPPPSFGSPAAWTFPVPTLADRRAVISNPFAGAKHLGVDIMFQRRSPSELATIYRAGSPNGTTLFFMPDDVPVLAASAGTVTFAAMTPVGNAVIIQHANGWSTYYAHLASLAVRKGQIVATGDKLGTIGASPTDGERVLHLHFELWTGRARSGAIDPAPYLAAWSRVTSPWSPVGSPLQVARNSLRRTERIRSRRNGALTTYRPVGDRGEPYPEWVRALRGEAGVYVIRDASTHECLYVGSSSTQLYDTLTRHFQVWRRYKGFWKGQYAEGADPGLTYPRGDVEVAVRLTKPDDALDTEMRLIARLRPRDNQIGQPDAAADETIPF